MKRIIDTRSTIVLLAALGLAACGSDSNDDTPPPPPPEEETISIDETTTLDLTITEFDGPGGAVSFKLTGDGQLPVTGASQFQVLYMGYPAAGPTSVKFGLTWHEASVLDCTDPTGHCDAVLTESDPGVYQVLASGLNWRDDVETYRAALSIQGAQVTTDPAWTE
ncbi:hypothetical protein KUV89_00725 [Marinobacter hydrocarbonoclasticus]|nr:hypothetical protein [Marinobacter nauticus]